MEAGILDIRFGEKTRFKGDNNNFYISPLEFILVLLQLQQMPSARESPQVSMKHHQEPRASIIMKMVSFPLQIRKSKGERRLSNPATHKNPLIIWSFFLKL